MLPISTRVYKEMGQNIDSVQNDLDYISPTGFVISSLKTDNQLQLKRHVMVFVL